MGKFLQGDWCSLDDVLLVPQRSDIKSRLDTDVSTQLTENISLNIPIISTNMSTVTEYPMAKAMFELGGAGALHRFNTIDEEVSMVDLLNKEGVYPIVASIGLGEQEKVRAKELVSSGADVILLDVAHAHNEEVLQQLKTLKGLYPERQFIVGNVATGDAVSELLLYGADGIRVGIGGGSRCTTRTVTGHGVPNLTAIIDAAYARDAHAENTGRYVPLIIDGGIKNSGDIVKSIAFGADVACLGYLLAGTRETPGRFLSETGDVVFKHYYGMSSKEAQNNHKNGVKEGIAAEGFSQVVPYKGPVVPVVNELVGGIRSGLTYSGARNLEELKEKAVVIRISSASQKESKLR